MTDDPMISFTCVFVKRFTKLIIRKKQKGDKLKEKVKLFRFCTRVTLKGRSLLRQELQSHKALNLPVFQQ